MDHTKRRDIGKDPKTQRNISVAIGKYGPYVQLGDRTDESNIKFVSIPSSLDIEKVTLKDALYLLSFPKDMGSYKDKTVQICMGKNGPYLKHGQEFFNVEETNAVSLNIEKIKEIIEKETKEAKNKILKDFGKIKVLNGIYGPYVSDGTKNAKIPKNKIIEELTESECKEILATKRKSWKKKS